MMIKTNLRGRAPMAFVSLAALTLMGSALISCNSHPVEFVSSSGAIDIVIPTPISQSTQMDILWVIDNSGSMCQEQQVLRENFRQFIETLTQTNLDFHIAVTTTHAPGNDPETGMPIQYTLEPVAIEGHLQSTPQPVPGNNVVCHNSEGRSDFDLIQNTLNFVKSTCLAQGQTFNQNWSPEQIQCALYSRPMGCDEGGLAVDTNGDGQFNEYDLFPQPSQYRQLPKVLKFDDYATNGVVDIDRLVDDFSCMSLVGTRGYGIEKGLQAAVRAVNPELTAEGGPNAGFLRDQAGLALIFVTDENDCSHDGTLNERSTCGGDVCEFANREEVEGNTPLYAPSVLRQNFMCNLGKSKGRSGISCEDGKFGVGDNELLVASIHGAFQRYTGQAPDTCTQPLVQPSCTSQQLGEAFSGDRYERFLREFGNYYPAPDADNPENPLTPWMCAGAFAPALQAIAEFINQIQPGCITELPLGCQGPNDGNCPPHPYSNEPGVCQAIPDSNRFFCDSGVQVRILPSGEVQNTPEETGYCVEGGINPPEVPGGCIVDKSRYVFDYEACGEGTGAFRISWVDEADARARLAGYTMEIRYAPGTEEPAAQ